ncbi:MAG: transposase [Nitrospinae bacterium]|nr:transposase [Nitrospinota bacterium]
MKKYRHFSEEFKRELVARIDSGELTGSQACREHHLSASLVDRWKRQIQKRGHPCLFDLLQIKQNEGRNWSPMFHEKKRRPGILEKLRWRWERVLPCD